MELIDLSQEIYQGMPVYPGHLKTVIWQHVGTWSGRGNLDTGSFPGASGYFRFTWETTAETRAGERSSMAGSLRSLYVCYLSLDDPLVDTQVVAYLEGLARRGHTIHLLTFEPRRGIQKRRIDAVRQQ